MENKVSISTLPYRFDELPKIFNELKECGADFAHCDIMDGQFVENKTYTPMMLQDIKGLMPLPLDVHLMVNDPLQYLSTLKGVAYYYTIHCECFNDMNTLKDALVSIKKSGLKVGLAVDLQTNIKSIFEVLNIVDLVLIMTVKAGAGGQKFSESALDKVTKLNLFKRNNNLFFEIEVDGGINDKTAKMCVNAGADIVVSGSFISSSNDKKNTINSLKFDK